MLQFSEFGRRISENGSAAGTDHGAAALMMAMGGARERRHLRHGAQPRTRPRQPTLENNGEDVRFETDFRAVYAR